MWCKYIIGYGVLEISKGALIVVKGREVINLYILQGLILKGLRYRYHMVMAYASGAYKRGMTKLSKKGLLCGQRTWNVDFYEHCVLGKQCG